MAEAFAFLLAAVAVAFVLGSAFALERRFNRRADAERRNEAS